MKAILVTNNIVAIRQAINLLSPFKFVFQHLPRSSDILRQKTGLIYLLLFQQERVGEHDCGPGFAMECDAKITYHNLCVIFLHGMTVADSEMKHRRNRWDVAPLAR